MNTRLINSDCLLVQKQIADNSIDLLLTDPPYNISDDGAKPVWIDPKTGKDKNTIHSQRFSENFEEDWDSVTHEVFLNYLEKWSELWFKKLKKGAAFAIFISDQYISYLWKIMETKGFEPKRVWNWKKPAAVPFNRNVMPVSGCEYVLWGIKPGAKRTFNSDCKEFSIIDRHSMADKISSILYKEFKDNFGTTSLDNIFAEALKSSKKVIDERKKNNNLVQSIIPNTFVYSGGLGKDKIHPTQKPIEILQYFIELLSNPGDTVLDTFAGSGSTGVAAQNVNRNFILIEKDPKMFIKMEERIKKSSLNADLFEIKNN